MASKTITDAIIEILAKEQNALTAKEIYSRIIKRDLYQFKSPSAENIVRNQLRRHCLGINNPASSSKKLFKVSDDAYTLLN